MIFILSFLVAVVAFVVWSSLRKKPIRSTADMHDLELQRSIYRTAVLGTGSLAGIALLVALSQCITQIPAGHVGVIDFFGQVSDRTLKSGVNSAIRWRELSKCRCRPKK